MKHQSEGFQEMTQRSGSGAASSIEHEVHRDSPRFMQALYQERVDQTPIWIMRQAGRYLPEYRALRKRAKNFLTLCQTPELACEATLQPIARYPLDAAILFSDILTIPEAMGLGLYFSEGEGPIFEHPIQTLKAIESHTTADQSNILSNLQYVFDAASLVRQSLPHHLPLIGFSGTPWTLACYMLEGRGSKTFESARRWIYQAPDALEALLNRLSKLIAEYLFQQIKVGASAMMLFDTWGGVLSPTAYQRFSLAPIQTIMQLLQDKTHAPVILYSKNNEHLEAQAQIGCRGIGVDWTIDIGVARKRTQGRVALQGNLDPCALLGTVGEITKEAQRVLKSYGNHPGLIFNLGHGISPHVEPEKVGHLIEVVQNF